MEKLNIRISIFYPFSISLTNNSIFKIFSNLSKNPYWKTLLVHDYCRCRFVVANDVLLFNVIVLICNYIDIDIDVGPICIIDGKSGGRLAFLTNWPN